nr:PREDICTED: group 10 secretory phospholipase A2 isoform X2 [Anolis carolinensis]|eukprot:XP_008106081.1 PREDICTED: group 10 secretory phospholipase A2 isoform X2 [Anolis carolinensis]
MEARLVTLLLFPTAKANSSPTVWNSVLGKTHSLHKRGIIELSGALQCTTGRFALMYLGYGCYCGQGGRGWPKDETDWCCHAHDCCYGFAQEQGCSPMIRRYKWTCKDNHVICDPTLDKCQKLMCQCDRDAAKCWRSSDFNQQYAFWPNVFCGRTYPVCGYKRH